MADAAAATAAVPSNGGAPAPAAAPASAPKTAAPVAGAKPPAAKGPPGAAPPKTAPSKPTREPVLWKRGEGDELDVSPFLESYEREVTIDGQKHRIHVDDAYSEFAKGRVADKRLSEHDRKTKDLERREMQFRQTLGMLTVDPKRPESRAEAFDFAGRMLSKRFGAENFEAFIVENFADFARLAKLPEAERRSIERDRALRDKLHEEQLQVRTERAQIEAEKRAKIEAARKERHARAGREWPPALLEHGVPQPWMGRAMPMVADELNRARKAGAPITEAVALRRVGKKLAAEAEALRPPAQAALEQPGRESPPIESQPKGDGHRFRDKGTPSPRPDDVRKELWGGR